MSDDELRLPAPPEEYDDAERDAWYAGAQTVLSALGQQCEMMVAAYDSGPTADDDADAPTADACPECDDGTIEQVFGTRRCAACGATPATGE